MTEEENNYMTSKNTNHNSFISRRRLLGTTLAGGLGITGVGLVTGKGVNKKQVPITRDNDGVARTTKIPRAVYERDMHVKNMAEVMSNRRKKNKNIDSVMVTDSKEEKDGHKITKLQISVPENGDPSQVPDSVQGVPIETIPPQNFKTGGCSNNGTYDPAEGGVKIVGQDTVGTGFGKVMDMTNGEPRYLACAHVVEEKDNVSCDTGESGSANVFQGGNKIGEVAKGSVDGDWAMIEQTDDADIEGFDNDINWVDHGGRDFEEFYTEWGLRETMKNNDTLYKSGLTSGSTDGTIESIDADIEVYCGNRTVDSSGDPYGVITSVDAGPGDSGSPVFTKYPDDPDNKLSAAGLWTNYDDESDSYDSGCSAGWTNYTPEKVYERTLFIPSYYHDNEYDFQPWLLS